MQQRVVALLLGHFSLAFVSLPSFRSRKASQESNKQERERERESKGERVAQLLALSCAPSLSLSLVAWLRFVATCSVSIVGRLRTERGQHGAR